MLKFFRTLEENLPVVSDGNVICFTSACDWWGCRGKRGQKVYLAQAEGPGALCVSAVAEIFTKISLWPNNCKLSGLFKKKTKTNKETQEFIQPSFS